MAKRAMVGRVVQRRQLQSMLTAPAKRCAKCGRENMPMSYFPEEHTCIYCNPDGLQVCGFGPEDFGTRRAK